MRACGPGRSTGVSSLRVPVRSSHALAERDEWIVVASPLDDEPVGDPSVVVAALFGLSERYAAGQEQETVIDDDSLPSYGGGDPQLADDIAEDVASRWDA